MFCSDSREMLFSVLKDLPGILSLHILLKLKCGQYPAIHTSYNISQSTTL